MLVRGEVLPDLDIDAEIEAIETSKLVDLDMGAVGGVPTDEEEQDAAEGDEGEEQESEIRQEVVRRMRRLAEDNDEEES